MTNMGWQHFLIFWGVWILIPLCIDVFKSLNDAFLVWRHRRMAKPYPPLPRRNLPKVSVIIPGLQRAVEHRPLHNQPQSANLPASPHRSYRD